MIEIESILIALSVIAVFALPHVIAKLLVPRLVDNYMSHLEEVE